MPGPGWVGSELMRDDDAWNAGLCCEDLLTTQFVEDEGSRRGKGLLDVLESRRSR
jgi:hypothetical protein